MHPHTLTAQNAEFHSGRYFRIFQPLPPWCWLAIILLGLGASFSAYPLLSTTAVAALAFAGVLLWKPGEPPILFVCWCLQWLQAVMALIYSDFYNVPLHRAFGAPFLDRATWLSLGGLVSLAVGMRLCLGKWDQAIPKLESELRAMSFPKALFAWWIMFLATYLLGMVVWRVGSLQQFLLPFTFIKWSIFCLIALWVMNQKQNYMVLGSLIAAEFFSGIVGYFASYKEVLIMIVIAAMGVRQRFSFGQRALVSLVAAVGLVTSIYWASIKQDYRTGLQFKWERQASIGFVERWKLINSLFDRVDRSTFDDGVLSLVARVSYTQLFGNTLDHVPSVVPHSGGELWLGAVKHVLMPRIIFKNKEILDDSKRAVRYTGLRLAGADEGTSIGIGYMAESYVDFGEAWMMLPIGGLGLAMGLVYRLQSRRYSHSIYGIALGTSILFSVVKAFENSNVKIVGALVSFTAIYWVLTPLFRRLEKWLWSDDYDRKQIDRPRHVNRGSLVR